MPSPGSLFTPLLCLSWLALAIGAKPVAQSVLNTTIYQYPQGNDTPGFVADSPWYLARLAQIPTLRTVAGPGQNPADGSLPRLRSNDGWEFPRENDWGTNVLVYVLDSGIRATHWEFTLGQNRVLHGAAVGSGIGGTGVEDEGDHGTGVAGLVAGRRTGVAKAATIVPVKIARIRDETPNTPADVHAGLQWAYADFLARRAANHHLKAVINISWIVRDNAAVANALDMVIAAGMHVVIAAGNGEGDECPGTPGVPPHRVRIGDHGQVVVSSIDWLDQWWNLYGPCVHLAAPGFNMPIASSTGDDDYHVEGATSQAAPLVSGVIAALISPGQPGEHMTPAEVRNLLLNTYTHPGIQELPPNTPDRILRSLILHHTPQ